MVIPLIEVLLLLIFLPHFSTGATVGNGSEFSEAEKATAKGILSRIFPTAERTLLLHFEIPGEERERILERCSGSTPNEMIVILAAQRSDSTLGYAVLDNVMGKDQFITYLLVVSGDLTVKDLEIVTYREPYGYEVRNKSWLEQFEGKKAGDRIRPGRDIRNITGATISVRAVTAGVNRTLCTLRTIQHRLPGRPSD